MTALATLLALAVSLAALAALAATDPKRRRVFGLPPLAAQPWRALGLAGLLLPGLALALLGNAAGFIVWLGAVSVAGWGVAALPPGAPARLARALRHRDGPAARLGRCGRDLVALARAAGGLPAIPARMDALEYRVAELERALARRAAAPIAAEPPPPARPEGPQAALRGR